jgi:hypothetical protein
MQTVVIVSGRVKYWAWFRIWRGSTRVPLQSIVVLINTLTIDRSFSADLICKIAHSLINQLECYF